MQALTALASEASDVNDPAALITPTTGNSVQSLEMEERAGGPPMPAAGVQGAAIKRMLNEDQDMPMSSAGEAVKIAGNGVGDAAMAAVDDRLDKAGELPHVNGYTATPPATNGDGVDYSRIVNMGGNEGESSVPAMSVDVDQPAAPVNTTVEHPQAAHPSSALHSSSLPSILNDASNSPAPSSSQNATVHASSEFSQTVPQPLDSASQPAEQDSHSQLTNSSQTIPSAPASQSHLAASTSSYQPPLSMDALPDAPAPLPSQLVNNSVDTTDLNQTGGAIPESEQLQQPFQAPPQPTLPQNGDSSYHPMPPTHPEQIAPPLVSPSLAKRPFEPDNSYNSLPYQADLLEPTVKRQKISPETEDQPAFQSGLHAAGFAKPEDEQDGSYDFQQGPAESSYSTEQLYTNGHSQQQQQLQQRPQPVQHDPQAHLAPHQRQQHLDQLYPPIQQPDDSFIDQSLLESSMDVDSKPHMQMMDSPGNFDNQAYAPPQIPSHPQPIPKEQNRYALSIIRALKKRSEAAAFLAPVDPVALGIPHYPQIITHPMDLGTVERKLSANQYYSVEDFAADVRLIWANCIRFNGPENTYSVYAKIMEGVFEKQYAKMPTLESIAFMKRSASPIDVKKSKSKVRRPSMAGGGRASGSRSMYNDDYDDWGPSTGSSMRSSAPAPKKPPKPKQPSLSMSAGMNYGGMGGMSSSASLQMQQLQQQQALVMQQMQQFQNGGMGGGIDNTAQQLKFCKEVIKELFKKVHQPYAYPFYDPVDYMALGIPDYPRVIRRPMDLGTMRRKLDSNQYPNALAFETDFKLIINNCFTYNAPGNPVHTMGEQLQNVFYMKWRELPQEQPMMGWGGPGGYGGNMYGNQGGGYDEFSDGETDQLSIMSQQLEQLQKHMMQMQQNARMKQNRQQSFGGPGPMQMQMQMPPMQQQQQMPAMAPPISPPVPVQKPPRPPPVPRERKPPAPKRKSDPNYAPSASTSAPKPRNTKSSARARGDGDWAPPARGKGDSDYEEEEIDVNVTFDMKQELAQKIGELDAAGRIEEVLVIIRNSAPQLLGEDGGEVELDIDQLDQRTLLRLYELAVRPIGRGRQLKPKKNKVKGRNRGVDEVAEEERINLLQAQLDAMADGTTAPPGGFPPGTMLPEMPAPAPAHAQHGRGDVASSSSEDEDDDASDSDSDNFAPDE